MYCFEIKDKVLSEICESEESSVNHITGYTEELGRELEFRGFIILKDCINYIAVSPTPKGKEFCVNGGYAAEIFRNQQKDADAELDRNSKEAAIKNSLSAIKLSKRANIISWISIIVSIVSLAVHYYFEIR